MIEHKSPVTMILLTMVTCGFYGIVWFLNIAKDIQTACGNVDEPNGTKDLLLTLVTCGLYGIYCWFKYATLLNEGIQAQGKPVNENLPVICLVSCLLGFGIVAPFLIQSELNKLAIAN